MTTISFKAREELKKKLNLLARSKGINLSSCIKLLLTEAMKKELNRVTENNMTVGQELVILESAKDDETFGPFSNADEFMESLENEITKSKV